jgi:hypothetical protein
MKVIVLETNGELEQVNSARVLLFDGTREALEYIEVSCTGPTRYWRHAEIVGHGEMIPLQAPAGEWLP